MCLCLWLVLACFLFLLFSVFGLFVFTETVCSCLSCWFVFVLRVLVCLCVFVCFVVVCSLVSFLLDAFVVCGVFLSFVV